MLTIIGARHESERSTQLTVVDVLRVTIGRVSRGGDRQKNPRMQVDGCSDLATNGAHRLRKRVPAGT